MSGEIDRFFIQPGRDRISKLDGQCRVAEGKDSDLYVVHALSAALFWIEIFAKPVADEIECQNS